MKMKHLVSLVSVSALALIAIAHGQAQARADKEIILNQVRDLQGEQIHSISIEEANAMARWDPAVDEPPLSLPKAIQAARKWLGAKGVKDQAMLGNVQLKTPLGEGMENKWFYVFLHYVPQGSGFPRALRVVVLMNGSVVDLKDK